jgi:hypothetical protein
MIGPNSSTIITLFPEVPNAIIFLLVHLYVLNELNDIEIEFYVTNNAQWLLQRRSVGPPSVSA